MPKSVSTANYYEKIVETGVRATKARSTFTYLKMVQDGSPEGERGN